MHAEVRSLPAVSQVSSVDQLSTLILQLHRQGDLQVFAIAILHQSQGGLFSCAKDRMREKSCVRKTENKISRKSIFKKKQLPFN